VSNSLRLRSKKLNDTPEPPPSTLQPAHDGAGN
jgi:hypothetical protein